MRFYTGSMFPREYHNAIFIAEHGSWNRSTPIGYRIAVAYPRPDGTARTEVFAEGVERCTRLGAARRCAGGPGWQFAPVSDDAADMIYRISYSSE